MQPSEHDDILGASVGEAIQASKEAFKFALLMGGFGLVVVIVSFLGGRLVEGIFGSISVPDFIRWMAAGACCLATYNTIRQSKASFRMKVFVVTVNLAGFGFAFLLTSISESIAVAFLMCVYFPSLNFFGQVYDALLAAGKTRRLELLDRENELAQLRQQLHEARETLADWR
jgi:hypothetical protein